MVWKESDRVSERLEFVKLASVEGANFSLHCERFGVSRKTGYKWLKRWRESGQTGLGDRSRRPSGSPARTSDATEQEVLAIRREHPAWGGRKIRKRLLALGVGSPPSASTITAILHREGFISEEESSKHTAFSRWERSDPNDLWQLDFKGEFKLTNGGNCYPLTLMDDHSRYALGVLACGNQRRITVQDHLRGVFDRYGIPRAIYVDNGSPWGTSCGTSRHTRLSVWLMRHEVKVIHGRPYYPQGRGKLERFHRTLKLELLQERSFDSLSVAQDAFDPWRSMYNHERPHEALDLEVPASRYRTSPRGFIERTRPYEYSSRFQTRKTNKRGQLHFHGKVYGISEAFLGERLGLSPTTTDGLWDVYYCGFSIGQLDEREVRFGRHQPVG